MSHCQDLVERPANKESQPNRLRAMFCEKTEKVAENLGCSETRGRRSQRGKNLKHHKDRYV